MSFRVRRFRGQWPADLLTFWAFEMEGVILGWFVLVVAESGLKLAVFDSLQFLGALISPLLGAESNATIVNFLHLRQK